MRNNPEPAGAPERIGTPAERQDVRPPVPYPHLHHDSEVEGWVCPDTGHFVTAGHMHSCPEGCAPGLCPIPWGEHIPARWTCRVWTARPVG